MKQHEHFSCETCFKWFKLPDEHQPKGYTFGHCRAHPPRVHFLPVPVVSAAPILKPHAAPQTQMTLQPQNIFPATQASEWCGEHTDWHRRVLESSPFDEPDPLIYDPDRYGLNHGFNRPPTLAEAKALAANQEDVARLEKGELKA